jgi:hypothetical protein
MFTKNLTSQTASDESDVRQLSQFKVGAEFPENIIFTRFGFLPVHDLWKFLFP